MGQGSTQRDCRKGGTHPPSYGNTTNIIHQNTNHYSFIQPHPMPNTHTIICHHTHCHTSTNPTIICPHNQHQTQHINRKVHLPIMIHPHTTIRCQHTHHHTPVYPSSDIYTIYIKCQHSYHLMTTHAPSYLSTANIRTHSQHHTSTHPPSYIHTTNII